MAFDLSVFESAVNSAEQQGVLYGQINIDGQHVRISKGLPKVSFDPSQHDSKDRKTELELTINPIDQMNINRLITRSVIAEFSGWTRMVFPSLKKLGITEPQQLAELNNQFVKVKIVPFGKPRVNDDGEEYQDTTFKFEAIYADEKDCVLAYHQDNNIEVDMDNIEPIPFDTGSDEPKQESSIGSQSNDAEKQATASFIPILVKQAQGDLSTLADLINQHPLTSKYFTVDSPEVQAALS